MSELLEKLVAADTEEERIPLYRQINTLEETGDDITHKIYLALDKVFFTPLSRKDIHLLASVIDDVADNIQEATGRMQLYDVEKFIPPIAEMTNYIKSSCQEIKKLVYALGKLTDPPALLETCRRVKEYEHQTDNTYYHALADLFAHEKDAITLIKNRDILYSLEASENKCKNVTDALEIIIINSI